MCEEVIKENDIHAEIEKIKDISKFADLGIMMTPGLIINDKVVSSGKIPTKSTLSHWIIDANN
jgi:hypothetical protein